ncbi:DNA primase [Spiroplasma alleghenense]|uniref:DNA primase n=1 Tax=Spiroplasma alleghenense TaxID=216931 RepID=A0A345Z3C8_9MOLU|nr:DNA primase [Spiroplasma alleghenense]AXK51107.1 DNA primase [Spiroplasma alleghenense]
MSDKISQELINKVIQQTDIIEIISSYIKLQKKGQNYQAICPFHKDNNPSMVISPAKKFYKCFSCNESGNVIDFVKNYENINFVEAIKKLALKLGLDVGFLKNFNSKPKFSSYQLKLFEINLHASKFFSAVLNNKVGIDAKKYLLSRKISEKEIAYWEIGFSFKESGLKDHLIQVGFKIEEIIDSGILKVFDTNIKDVFVNRLMFPIKNEDGHIIGFSGRVINQNDSPKYLNTFETKIFKKSELAFNFNNAKNEIKRNDEIIILEGFMDVISLNRAEIKNSVAIMGTSLSDFQVDLFKKITKNFVLFLDGDEPGVRAALKAACKLMDLGINVKIIDNDSNLDPDELINKFGAKKIRELIDKSQHPIDFAINYFSRKLDLNDQIGLEQFMKEIKNILIHIRGEIFQAKAISKISKILNLNEDTVRNSIDVRSNALKTEFKKSENFNFKEELPKNNLSNEIKTLKSYRFAEESIIYYLVNNRDKLDYLEDNLNLINNSNNKKLINKIIEIYRVHNLEPGQPEEIKKYLSDESKSAKLINQFDKIINETNYFFLKSVLSNHGLEDSLSILETKKIEDNNKSYLKKMEATSDLALKENYNKIIEKNYIEVIKLRKKREKK